MLKAETSIIVLHHDPKGYYDMVTWPNLLIGINSKGDTIGIVEYGTELQINRNDTITFSPKQIKETILEPSAFIRKPVMSVSKKAKINDLYCSVKVIYYGKLKGISSNP